MKSLPCSFGSTHGKHSAHGKEPAQRSAKAAAHGKQSKNARQSNLHGNEEAKAHGKETVHGKESFAVHTIPLPCVFARHRGQFYFFSFFCSIYIYINTYICCKISFYFL
jgi:hypothetical protein